MYEVRVNDAFITYGKISATMRREEDTLITEGIFKTHMYIEEIDNLECDRFRLTGIDVQAEAFGSTDPFIVYYFTFKDIETYYEDLEYEEEELISLYKNDEE